MRAAVYDRFGPPEVVEIREVPVPAPGHGEILVRVRAAALNPKDVLTRSGKFRAIARLAGVRFPARLGYDWSGEVAAVGPGVRGAREGDALFGMIQAWRAGACAEYCVVRPGECAPKPSSLDWADAAALPLVSLTALQALRDLGRAGPGARVLVHGASGGVGAHAVQIARALGAEVTTTSSSVNVALCRALGAHEALDYRAIDPLRARGPFDVVFDVFGNRRYAEARPALAARGAYVTTVPSARIAIDQARTLAPSGARARLVVVRARRADLEEIAALVARGALRPVIDSVHQLGAIAAAQAVVASKRARGKVVVRVADGHV